MAKYKYAKKPKNLKNFAKIFGLGAILSGFILFFYTFFPLISWQIYFAPAFASQKIDSPIPINSLISSATEGISSDFTNAYNWYPGFTSAGNNEVEYTLTIPKINLVATKVSNKDFDLTKHLVQFNKDTYPSKAGNSIIFGHSTLPQLYDRNNYKTIFTNLYKLEAGDEIIVGINNKTYKYNVESIIVVEPEDTTVLSQNFTDSFLTLITCTPPGTIWKRLVVKARIEEF